MSAALWVEKYKKYMRRQKGFTLIEMLIVIAIIGLLASIVLINFEGAKTKAKIAKAEEELVQIRSAIGVAQYSQGKVLIDITENADCCSDWPCRFETDLSSLSSDHQCIINWESVAEKIGFPAIRDPWGSPYLIDENELEKSRCPTNDVGNCDRGDRISSAGPDRQMETSDDITFYVPFYSTQCSVLK